MKKFLTKYTLYNQPSNSPLVPNDIRYSCGSSDQESMSIMDAYQGVATRRLF